jgi:hypothetical protein
MFLKGGLGNQLFQYYAGYHLAKRLGVDLIVDLNQAKFGKTGHGNAIANLGLPGIFVMATSRLSVNYIWSMIRYRTLGILHFIFRSQEFLLKVFFTYRSRDVGFDHKLGEINKPVTLEGYFQTWRYYDDLKSMEDFTLPDSTHKSKWFLERQLELTASKVAAVHVRRGDYISESGKIGLLAQEYFLSALQDLEKSGAMFDEIWIFTDDVDEVKAKFNDLLVNYKTQIVNPPPSSSAFESLLLMSQASLLVTSNSTFSYWAALLGSSNRTVIVPEKWFQGLEDPEYLYPEKWRKVPPIWELGDFDRPLPGEKAVPETPKEGN